MRSNRIRWSGIILVPVLLGGLGWLLSALLDPGIAPQPRWSQEAKGLTAFTMSPEGRWVLTHQWPGDGKYEGRLQVWDTIADRVVYQRDRNFYLADMIDPEAFRAFFSPDWRWFLLPLKYSFLTPGEFEDCLLIDLSTGRETLVKTSLRYRAAWERDPKLFEELIPRGLGGLAMMTRGVMEVSPDQQYVAVMLDGMSLFIVETATGNVVGERFNIRKALPYRGTPTFAFAPEGHRLLFHGWNANRSAMALWSWDLGDGEPRLLQDGVAAVPLVAPAHDFWVLLAASGANGYQLLLWDVRGGEARKLLDTTRQYWQVAVSPTGRWLAAWNPLEAKTREPLQALLWDLPRAELRRQWEYPTFVRCDFSPAGPWLVVQFTDTIEAHDLIQDKRLWRTELTNAARGTIHCQDTSPTFLWRAYETEAPRIYDISTGRPTLPDWFGSDVWKDVPLERRIQPAGRDRCLVVTGTAPDAGTARVVELSSGQVVASFPGLALKRAYAETLSDDGSSLLISRPVNENIERLEIWDVPPQDRPLPKPWHWIIGIPMLVALTLGLLWTVRRGFPYIAPHMPNDSR
jgi:hypothetical protein